MRRPFLTRSLAVVVASVVSGCGGGGGGGASQSGVALTAPALASNSYANYKQIGLVPLLLPAGDNTVRAYGNFSGSGRLDFFRAVLTYNVSNGVAGATPSRFEFYSMGADGSFSQNTTLLANPNGCIHPRKAIVADFNGDGRPDIFVACHGYDGNPFPGEKNKVVVSQPNGTYQISDASTDVGFHHGATATDLNNDGKIDVILVDNKTPYVYTLINNGSGFFTRESPSRLPSLTGTPYTVELIDINNDGKLDLLLGGHEWAGAPTGLFLNPGNNNFSGVSQTTIPAVPNNGVVLDFTATGSGANRSLWILRTSGGVGVTLYQSKVVQKVTYPGLLSSIPLNQQPAAWIPWLIPARQGAVDVITSDNSVDDVSIPQ